MNSMQPAKGSDCVEEQGGDTTSELFDIAERLLKEAQRQGADAAEVSVSDHTGLSVGVRLRGVESVEFTRDRSMALNVYIGGRRGMASTSDARTQTMVEIAGKALNFARHTESDPCNGLAEPALLATEFPDLDLFHPVPMDTESLKESALRAEAAALDADGRIVNSHGASSWQQAGSEVYANSHGFIGSSRGTQYGISVGVIATDEGGLFSLG